MTDTVDGKNPAPPDMYETCLNNMTFTSRMSSINQRTGALENNCLTPFTRHFTTREYQRYVFGCHRVTRGFVPCHGRTPSCHAPCAQLRLMVSLHSLKLTVRT